jgi:hypothetical protein
MAKILEQLKEVIRLQEIIIENQIELDDKLLFFPSARDCSEEQIKYMNMVGNMIENINKWGLK